MSLLKFLSGDWETARSLAEEAQAAELPGALAGFGAVMLLRLGAYSGDRDRVFQLIDQTRSQFPMPGRPNTIGAWSLLMGGVESLAMVGEHQRAAELYPLVRELLGCGAVNISFARQFPETIAGIAAGAVGDWDAAEQHFTVALRQATEFPHWLRRRKCGGFMP